MGSCDESKGQSDDFQGSRSEQIIFGRTFLSSFIFCSTLHSFPFSGL